MTGKKMERICIDFRLRADRYWTSFRSFLVRNREHLSLTDQGDPGEYYLGGVWPDGVPGSLIVSNVSFDDQHSTWLIRPPVEGPKASSFAAGRLAPAFTAYRRQARLVVNGFEVAPHVSPRPFEVLLSGLMFINPSDSYMEEGDLRFLEDLPRHRKITGERLRLWREYLDWKEKLAKLLQITLRYEGYALSENGRLRFSLTEKQNICALKRQVLNSELLAAPLIASESSDRWICKRYSRASFVEVGSVVLIEPVEEIGAEKAQSSHDGHAEEKVSVAIVLEPDEEDLEAIESGLQKIPDEGFLVSSIAGDIAPLNNQRRAIQRLLNGRGFAPHLGDYLFDIKNAAVPESRVDVFENQDSLVSLNTDQKRAVEKALAASDICLIQGPPGTGKTTAIAEICYRVAKEGGRVLVASQTNLAVDNVLSCLANRPEMRPLRIGKAERIEEEHQEFLEERVTERWFRGIRQDCEERLREREALVEKTVKVNRALSALQRILEDIDELRGRIHSLEQERGKHVSSRDTASEELRIATITAEECRRQLGSLADLKQWTNGLDSVVTQAEWFDNTPVARELIETANEVRKNLPKSDWGFPWPIDGEVLTASDALAELHWAQKVLAASQRTESPLREALSMCTEGRVRVTSESAKCLDELRTQKELLIDSENEEDALRLPEINRTIKRLEKEVWGRAGSNLGRAISDLFIGGVPDSLATLTSSLAPDTKWSKPLQSLLTFSSQLYTIVETVLKRGFANISDLAGNVEEELNLRVGELKEFISVSRMRIKEFDSSIGQLEDDLTVSREQLAERESRWAERWPDACPDLSESSVNTPLPDFRVLEARRNAVSRWSRGNVTAVEDHGRWSAIQDEWLHRIRNPSTGDMQGVQSLYVKHSNIIGITCNEAGRPSLFDNPGFEPFDVVIIDEVSKATPPELLMPMLLGRKTVLVGDHRQLPPMFRERESSFGEAAADGEIEAADFERFHRMVTSSLFRELFEQAPEELRESLFLQYRMHPQIMTVVNYFYEHKLIAGPGEDELGQMRQHGLQIRDERGGVFLEPHNHVLWVDSSRQWPQGNILEEQQRGTSKSNHLEVRLIAESLIRINAALKGLGYGPRCKNPVIAREVEVGLTLKEWVGEFLKSPLEDTLKDLYERKRIWLNQRIGKPDERICAGDELTVDPRMSVGVITFYGAQLRDIRQWIRTQNPHTLDALDLRTNTVDRFQGMERSILLVSLVRSRPFGRGGGHVKQYQRVNVALSRAQKLLIIVGAAETFKQAQIDLPPLTGGEPVQVPVYQRIHEYAEQIGGLIRAWELLPARERTGRKYRRHSNVGRTRT